MHVRQNLAVTVLFMCAIFTRQQLCPPFMKNANDSFRIPCSVRAPVWEHAVCQAVLAVAKICLSGSLRIPQTQTHISRTKRVTSWARNPCKGGHLLSARQRHTIHFFVNDDDTYKTITAGVWPWLSCTSPFIL